MSFIDSLPLGEVPSTPQIPDIKNSLQVDFELCKDSIGINWYTICSMLIIILYQLRLAYYYVTREYDHLGMYCLNRQIKHLIMTLFFIPMNMIFNVISGLEACYWLIIYFQLFSRARPSRAQVALSRVSPVVEIQLEEVVIVSPTTEV